MWSLITLSVLSFLSHLKPECIFLKIKLANTVLLSKAITLTQATDGGLYECQISTTPIMSHNVYLLVSG